MNYAIIVDIVGAIEIDFVFVTLAPDHINTAGGDVYSVHLKQIYIICRA